MYLDQFSLEKLTIIGNGFEHFKIEHAPLGITGFGSSDYKRVIVDAAKNIEKSHLILYAEAADKTLTAGYEYVALAKIPQIKLLKYQNYRDYIEVLKSSKYMICAPSIYSDSFGFWESIHLNTVPVIMRDQWKKVYTGHRVLVVDSLTDLLSMDLEREYVRFF